MWKGKITEVLGLWNTNYTFTVRWWHLFIEVGPFSSKYILTCNEILSPLQIWMSLFRLQQCWHLMGSLVIMCIYNDTSFAFFTLWHMLRLLFYHLTDAVFVISFILTHPLLFFHSLVMLGYMTSNLTQVIVTRKGSLALQVCLFFLCVFTYTTKIFQLPFLSGCFHCL